MLIGIPTLDQNSKGEVGISDSLVNINSISRLRPVELQRMNSTTNQVETLMGTLIQTWGGDVVTPMNIDELQNHINSQQRRAELMRGIR